MSIRYFPSLKEGKLWEKAEQRQPNASDINIARAGPARHQGVFPRESGASYDLKNPELVASTDRQLLL